MSKNSIFLVISRLILAVCQITVIWLWCHCTHRTLIWCRMTSKSSFELWGHFWEKWETSKTVFLVKCELILTVSQTSVIRFWCNCTNRTVVWCGMTSFDRFDGFWNNWRVHNWQFRGPLWATFGCFLSADVRLWCHSTCTWRTLIWCRNTIGELVRIVRTVFVIESPKMIFWSFRGYLSDHSHLILMPLHT